MNINDEQLYFIFFLESNHYLVDLKEDDKINDCYRKNEGCLFVIESQLCDIILGNAAIIQENSFVRLGKMITYNSLFQDTVSYSNIKL